jgi:hypothetical protein
MKVMELNQPIEEQHNWLDLAKPASNALYLLLKLRTDQAKIFSLTKGNISKRKKAKSSCIINTMPVNTAKQDLTFNR